MPGEQRKRKTENKQNKKCRVKKCGNILSAAEGETTSNCENGDIFIKD